ncbi:reverse transcriptase domain-containing protein [Tanacetum coccineum]
MLKALLSNKEKLLELANTPLNENCSAVILKKLLEKLGDPGKYLIPCSFSELNCKALADLGASTNLMPLSVRKKLGLSELISTRMTLELANRSVCTPARIARDVFVPLKNMMASFFQMNTASSSGSGSLPSNTIANPKGELKAITTRSGIVLDGPSVLMPPPFINPEEDERAEETLTDPELAEYTIKVPPPLVQKPQAPS